MSGLFPSEAYRELCIKNQKVLREEWEPKPGDWYISLDRSYEDRDITSAPVHTPLIMNWSIAKSLRRPGEVWLPRLDQLIEMLEERGVLSWVVGRVGPEHPDCDPMEEAIEGAKYYASPMPISKETISEGPDPATALLKAYLEVVQEKGNG